MTGHLRSFLRRLRSRVYGAAMNAGIVPYRRIQVREPEVWDAEYAGTQLDYYGGLAELSRSSLLLGYMANLGGTPEVLDVGCGVGLLRERMDRLQFARYVGIDVSLVAIERAVALSDARTTFLIGELPAPETGPFDIVVMSEVLYLFEDPAGVLDRVHTLLRPGGVLLTSISPHRGDRALYRLIDRRFACLDSVYARCDAKNHGWRVSMYRALDTAIAPASEPVRPLTP